MQYLSCPVFIQRGSREGLFKVKWMRLLNLDNK